MNLLTKTVIVLTLCLWPLSLFLSNSFKDIGNDLKNYYHFSIFAPDDQAPLIISTKRSIYQSDLLGRLYNNKATFIWGRFKSNFFAIVDPNNYFFGFHPREIVRENLNIEKFPFISIFFFLYAIYRIKAFKGAGLLVAVFLVLTVLLSLANFDKVDFILYPVLAGFMIRGITSMSEEKPKFFLTVSFLLILFAIPQYLRVFVNIPHQ